MDAAVKPVFTATVRVTRAAAPHEDHDPALPCRPADQPGKCHLIEDQEISSHV